MTKEKYFIKKIASQDMICCIDEMTGDFYGYPLETLKNILNEYSVNVNELKSKIAFLKQEISDKETKWAKYSRKFAIEQLEKVKELTHNNYILCGWIPNQALENRINQQIKDLKEKL